MHLFALKKKIIGVIALELFYYLDDFKLSLKYKRKYRCYFRNCLSNEISSFLIKGTNGKDRFNKFE